MPFLPFCHCDAGTVRIFRVEAPPYKLNYCQMNLAAACSGFAAPSVAGQRKCLILSIVIITGRWRRSCD